MHLAIQIISDGTGASDASLPQSAREQIAGHFSDRLSVQWLPPVVTRAHDVAGFAVSSTILIFVAGIAFATVIKPFVESAAREAGKDFWALIKQLVARIRKAQSEQGYALTGSVYIFVNLNEESVAIKFPLPPPHEKITCDLIATHIDKYLANLQQSAGEIEAKVKQLRLGATRSYAPTGARGRVDCNVVHVVEPTAGRFDIFPVPASDIFQGQG